MRSDPYLQEIGRKIKPARNAKNMTVRTLGELCEINYSSLSRIECGQYSSRILTLKAIADVLETDVKEFL